MRVIYVYGKRWWWLRSVFGLPWVKDYIILDSYGAGYCVRDGLVVCVEPTFEVPVKEIYLESINDLQHLALTAATAEELLSKALLDGKTYTLEEAVFLIENIYEPTQGY